MINMKTDASALLTSNQILQLYHPDKSDVKWLTSTSEKWPANIRRG